MGVTLPITLPLNKFRRNITPKGKTCAAVTKTMGRVMGRNKANHLNDPRKKLGKMAIRDGQ